VHSSPFQGGFTVQDFADFTDFRHVSLHKAF
jgi:hypothetical protein